MEIRMFIFDLIVYEIVKGTMSMCKIADIQDLEWDVKLINIVIRNRVLIWHDLSILT